MTLDATPAGADANSYLTVAGADALAGEDIGPEATAWLALVNATPADLAKKEAALKRATREIDEYLRTGFTKAVAGQRLRFPRADVDVDGDGDPAIPRGIELATYQQAIYLVKNAAVIAAANTRRARNMQSASEPDISYSQGADDGMSILSAQALHYLAGFAVATRSQRAGGVRSVRVRSGFVGAP